MVLRLIATAKPVTNKMFEMFAPMMFPGTISETPSRTAKIPEINSGSEVPIPTIKIPITNGGNLNQAPIFSAAEVKNFAENNKPVKAKINITRLNNI